MSYTYQTFNSGQILTGGQAQQIEDNIRDHVHGSAGVGPSGASWSVSSKGAAFSIASTDAGRLFKCYGDYAIDFAAAATLGGNFTAAFYNAGSGRIALQATSGQYIHDNSLYVLTPGESLFVNSDAIELMVSGGNPNGPCRLVRQPITVSSLGNFDITKLFANDFARYQLRAQFVQGSASIINMRFSQDSGSSFLSTGYVDTDGDTTVIRAFRLATNSAQGVLMIADFVNDSSMNSMAMVLNQQTIRGTAGTYSNELAIGLQSGSPGQINALRFFATSGNLQPGTLVELWGFGRPRR